MKLGTETGSLTNWMMSDTRNQPTPVVGMGLTLLHWTDREVATITKVSPSGKTFWFKADIATRIDSNGMSECQVYSYSPDDTAPERKAVLTRRGRWKEIRGSQIRLDARIAYHDFSF